MPRMIFSCLSILCLNMNCLTWSHVDHTDNSSGECVPSSEKQHHIPNMVFAKMHQKVWKNNSNRSNSPGDALLQLLRQRAGRTVAGLRQRFPGSWVVPMPQSADQHLFRLPSVHPSELLRLWIVEKIETFGTEPGWIKCWFVILYAC